MSLFRQWIGAAFLSLAVGGFFQLFISFNSFSSFDFFGSLLIFFGLSLFALFLFGYGWKFREGLVLFLALCAGFYYLRDSIGSSLNTFVTWWIFGTLMILIILASFFILTDD